MSGLPNLTQYKKIGVMGGTFDPIHIGHLVAAESARAEFELDLVIFMPAGMPSFKRDKKVTDKEHRYAMTLTAVNDNPFFAVSRMEIERGGVTYTVDTMRELKALCGGAELYFITGADAAMEIFKWRGVADLLGLCRIIAVTRDGCDESQLSDVTERIKNEYGGGAFVLKIPDIGVSSSDLRRRLTSGKPVKYLLPDSVERYITKNKLYPAETDIDAIIAALKERLTERRYLHSLDVAAEAKALAEHFGEDEEKAYLAGLLHDIAKGAVTPDLEHGPAGAKTAEQEFNVTDTGVLDAIRYHTTGRTNMSRLEKIIYIADCIEPSRGSGEDIDRIRAAAYRDLDAAMIMAIQRKIEYTKQKNKPVLPVSIEALDFLTYNYQSDKEDF